MITEEKIKVFVYGTLKVGGKFARHYDPHRLSTKPGTIKGTMFDILGSFPGVVLNGETVISGEVHEYSNPEKVVPSLDNLEGFNGDNNPNNLYNKEVILVTTDEGEELCQVYTFARDTEKYKEVKTGVWEI